MTSGQALWRHNPGQRCVSACLRVPRHPASFAALPCRPRRCSCPRQHYGDQWHLAFAARAAKLRRRAKMHLCVFRSWWTVCSTKRCELVRAVASGTATVTQSRQGRGVQTFPRRCLGPVALRQCQKANSTEFAQPCFSWVVSARSTMEIGMSFWPREKRTPKL